VEVNVTVVGYALEIAQAAQEAAPIAA